LRSPSPGGSLFIIWDIREDDDALACVGGTAIQRDSALLQGARETPYNRKEGGVDEIEDHVLLVRMPILLVVRNILEGLHARSKGIS
jgi:hypothetical protein